MAIFCNSDFAHKFSLINPNKTPVDLPSTALFEIRLVNMTTEDELLFTVENGFLTLDVDNASFTLELPADYTKDMIPGEYRVICHRTDNQRSRLFTGIIRVKDANGE